MSLFLLYGQRFPRYGPIFKIAILGNWPNSRSCTYTLFLPQGVQIELNFALRSEVSEIRIKIAIFGHETWQVAKVPEVAHIPSFYPRGSKLSLFFLYGQRFPRYRPIFKIPIFGHETRPLARVPEVAHIASLYPRGSNLSLFLLYGQQFLRYGPIFKIAIFGHKTWPLEFLGGGGGEFLKK